MFITHTAFSFITNFLLLKKQLTVSGKTICIDLQLIMKYKLQQFLS